MKQHLAVILTLFLSVLILSGCDNTFEPIQENDKYVFSMYGALDIHADTQWVRVMPIRDKLFNSDPAPNGTVVTLTRVETGEVTVLNDSLFRFGGVSHVWNYWTTEALHPLEQYTLTATTPDNRKSTAAIMTPLPLPTPEIEYDIATNYGVVTGVINQRLVVAQVIYHIRVTDDFGMVSDEIVETFSQLGSAFINQSDGTYRFTIATSSLLSGRLGVPFSRITITKMKIQIAGSLTDWPFYGSLTLEEIYLPEVISNVENGAGYVATVASKIFEVNLRP